VRVQGRVGVFLRLAQRWAELFAGKPIESAVEFCLEPDFANRSGKYPAAEGGGSESCRG